MSAVGIDSTKPVAQRGLQAAMPWPPTKLITPLPWQEQAIRAWERKGCCGIVEAVTGTGKTYLGIEVIDRLIRGPKQVSTLIVVPTVVLMEQWRNRLQAAWTPAQRVGLIGDGHADNFSCSPIACVAVINSAVQKVRSLFPHVTKSPNRWTTLLIADECHRYAQAPVWSKLTRLHPFNHILGLTATMQTYQAGGLGKIVFEYTFRNAFEDGLVPCFDLVTVEVELDGNERSEYLKLTEQISDQLAEVRRLFGDELEGASDDAFFPLLRQLMTQGAGSTTGHEPSIKKLFVLLFKRAAVVYLARSKMALCEQLLRCLVGRHGKKTIVFFERIQSAEGLDDSLAGGTQLDRQATSLLRASLSRAGGAVDNGQVPTMLFHSQMNPLERRSSLSQFAKSGRCAMLACRALDEGLDLPDVEAAILVSSTQSLRQRIQRIGRTLRRGNGTKRPMIVSMHVKGTSDMNMTDDDHSTFGPAATLHTVTGETALRTIAKLLSR